MKINLNKNKKDKSLFFHRNCPLCVSIDSTQMITFDNYQYLNDHKNKSIHNLIDITIMECNKCGTVFNKYGFTKRGFKILFEGMGQSYGALPHRAKEQIKYLKNNKILKNVYSILDLGCFEGKFLNLFSGDIKKTGIDIDLPAINRAKINFSDINFYCQDLESFKVNDKFDLIIMCHVLEHLNNPLNALKNILKHSHQKSYLFIEIPIIENAITNDITGMIGAQHLTHFSEHSIKNFLLKSGWKIIKYNKTKYGAARIICQPNRNKSKIKINLNFNRKFLYKFFSNLYLNYHNIEKKLGIIKSNKFIIWGAGLHTELIINKLRFFQNNKTKKIIFFDNDKNKIGKKFRNISIVEPFKINLSQWKDAYIIISTYRGTNEIYNECIRAGWDKNKIIKLYSSFKLY